MSQPADYIVVVSNEDDSQTGFHHFSEKVNRKLRCGLRQLLGYPFSVGAVGVSGHGKASTVWRGIHFPQPSKALGDTTMFYHRPSAT